MWTSTMCIKSRWKEYIFFWWSKAWETKRKTLAIRDFLFSSFSKLIFFIILFFVFFSFYLSCSFRKDFHYFHFVFLRLRICCCCCCFGIVSSSLFHKCLVMHIIKFVLNSKIIFLFFSNETRNRFLLKLAPLFPLLYHSWYTNFYYKSHLNILR